MLIGHRKEIRKVTFRSVSPSSERISIRSDEDLTLDMFATESLFGCQFTLSTQLIKPNYLVDSDVALVTVAPNSELMCWVCRSEETVLNLSLSIPYGGRRYWATNCFNFLKNCPPMEREGQGWQRSSMCYMFKLKLQLFLVKKSSEQIAFSLSTTWVSSHCAFLPGSTGTIMAKLPGFFFGRTKFTHT